MNKPSQMSALAIARFSLCFLSLVFTSSCCFAQTAISDLKILDSNADGIINPYEALDALLVLDQEGGRSLSIAEIKTLAAESRKERDNEMKAMLSELDTNKDGTINLAEVDGDMLGFARTFDTNGDEIISPSEVKNINFEDSLLSSEKEIQERLESIFSERDVNRDGLISIVDEVDKRDRDNFAEWDNNRNLEVTREEVYNFMKADNTPVEFKVTGDTALMTGVITSSLPAVVLQLIFEHPNVTTIEMQIVPGSIDDVANLRAALYVRQFGLATKLNSRSSIASGGTDFFLAGKQRYVEKGATIGVHSWSGGAGIDGRDVPRDDPEHQKYIEYYKLVDIPESFYWYTMEAASPGDIHLMTEEEIETYKVRTPVEP